MSTFPASTPKTRQDKVTPIKVVAAALMLAVGVSILAYAMSDNEAAKRDYLCYWAAGQQLVHHQNPYDSDGILRIQRSAGYKENHPFYMRNPPIAFFIAYPLGLVGARTGAVIWSVALVACLMISIRMLWIINGRPDDRLHLVGYLFPSALACLLAGQTGIFLLFGIVLFLYLNKSNPYLAGMGLLVIALKPHLFLPFGAVLLLWIFLTRSFRVLAGALTAVGFCIVIALILDHSCWAHYFTMVKAENIGEEFVPTLSLLFRVVIAREHAWVQFIPAVIACQWAIRHYLDNREHWDWQKNAPLLLLASIIVAPYAWFTDEVIVLPAILAGLYRTRKLLIPYCCVAGVALIEVFANARIASGAYLWTAPAWLLWYFFATRAPSQDRERSVSNAAA
jgi:hypothetical protein